MPTGWPVELRGVSESIVATLGPNDRYNFAALGLHAPEDGIVPGNTDTVRARTWGRTRTWRNFTERGNGVVQFSPDPVLFVDAALDIYEQEEPVHSTATAWVAVSVEKTGEGTEGETQWVDWEVTPEESEQRKPQSPAFNRGYAAVVEATVAASRLDVDSYDTETLLERIEYFETVVENCGGPREREAFRRIASLTAEL